ncbi:TonB-dependent receptor [Cecembia calidifontis]|uniref:Outer membrane receptor for ferrienterochelin and colicins n=1 Tax=Cecembia calidifontis TaxID=1187080 RepID=A0A4V2F632_9BACT|nr:TonB-dependent receptor [Cecembia calidifontis]RZS94909.1 outer membrane receptor for ferrienterochelin and colicins [Cecembia calidifontis]
MIRFNLNKFSLFFFCMLLVFCSFAMPEKGLRGKVVDEKGRPIPFATVQFGDAKGVVADVEGVFDIGNWETVSFLKISAVGYNSQTFPYQPESSTSVFVLKEALNDLKEVVITGNFGPQSARQSTYMVRSIDKERIQQRAAGNLQEVLNTELGIRFSQDNALGSSNLEMMGMSGQNVKILIDGVPMFGRQGVNNEINLNQIDINQIEKIEIVEGPMAVIYGADALAGVINIITKKPDSKAGYILSTRLQEETAGNEYSPFHGAGNRIRSIQGTYTAAGPLSLGMGLTQNQFGGWKGPQTGRMFQWLPKDQWLANASVGFRKDKVELDYQVDFLDEIITSFGPENRLEVIDRNFITQRWMHRLNAKVDFSPTFQWSTQMAYTDFKRETQTWVTNIRTNEKNLSRQEGSQALVTHQGFTFRTIGNWLLSPNLTLMPGIDINTEWGIGDRISENSGIQDYAAFLTGEWRISSFLQVRPGLRTAYNSAYQAPPLIPSINTKLAISTKLDLRLAYANGFRAPSIRELYFDFFDASHSIAGNPDLLPERSDSFNASLTFQDKEHALGWKTVFSAFHNEVRDRIAYGMDPSDPRITTLFNIEKYRTQGLMLNQSLRANRWSFDAGASYIGRFNLLSQEDQALPVMMFSPEINSNITYKIPFIETDINLFYKWTGPLPGFELAAGDGGQAVPSQIMLEGFHWMDLTFSKRLRIGVTVIGGARNLFNISDIMSTSTAGSAHGGGPARPMGFGRSYFIGITYQLSK